MILCDVFTGGVVLVFKNLLPKIGRRVFWRSSFYGVLKLFASLYFASILISCSNPLGNNSSAQTNFLTSIGASNLTDKDDTSLGFGGGSFTGTAWDATNNYLSLSQAGTATDLAQDSSWTPAWSNLVGYWKFDEASWNGTTGEVIDSSGNGNNLTSAGGANTSNAVAMFNRSGNFPNTTSSQDSRVYSTTMPNVSQFSFSMWVYKTGANSANWGRWLLLGSEASYSLVCDDTPSSTFYCYSHYAPVSSGGTTAAFSNNTWYHIAFTYDGSTFRFYENGVLQSVSTGGSALPANPLNPMNIGADPNGNGGPGSYIDDVAVWNTVLSASAVASIYQHQSAKYAGTFQSRVMDGLASGATWSTLGWTPTLPFYKELPDGGASESSSNYSSLSTGLMSGIQGLWHMDEPVGTAGAGSILDRSGQASNGTPSGVTFGVSGKFGTATSFNGSSGITISSLSLGTTYTFMAWVRPTLLDGNIRCIMRVNTAPGSSLYFWGNTFKFYDGSPTIDYPGPVSVGRWYQVVGTYDGTNKKLYVNGSYVGSQASSSAPNSTSLTIGTDGFSQNFYGIMDEVAIWNRVLQANEVLELYRRGANRIEYQVRSCPDALCSTSSSWIGPDGTNQTYFSELNNNLVQSAGGDLTSSDAVQATLPTMNFSAFGALTIAPNRYFQYRAIMESDDSGTACSYGSGPTWCSPELQIVSTTIH
jgi:hypothetical protein